MIRPLTLLACLLAGLAWAGQGMGPGPGVKGYATAGGGGISETFGDLTNWTHEAGTWTLNSGTVDPPVFSYARLIHNTAPGLNQWACVQFLSQGTYSGTTDASLLLRHTTSGTYYLVGRYGTSVIRWMAYNGNTWVANGSSDWTMTLNDGDYLCAEITGTGSAPTLKGWVFTSAPPAYASWGAADHTWSSKPGTTSYAGTNVGIRANAASTSLRFDNFSADAP